MEDLQEIYSRIAKDIDNACFKKIDEVAQIEHIDTIEALKRAIKQLNRPDYFLISNAVHKAVLEEFAKTIVPVKIKMLYSPLVDDKTFYLLKNDGTQDGSFGYSEVLYDVEPLKFPTYEFHITHPEFITKVVVD